MSTFSIKIVADCGTRFFQVTTIFYAGYNVEIHNCFGNYFYTLCGVVILYYQLYTQFLFLFQHSLLSSPFSYIVSPIFNRIDINIVGYSKIIVED